MNEFLLLQYTAKINEFMLMSLFGELKLIS